MKFIKHSIYGIATCGEYKGYNVEIIDFIPKTYLIEVGSEREIISKIPKNVNDKIGGCIITKDLGKNGSFYKYLAFCRVESIQQKKNLNIRGDKAKILKGEFKGVEGRVESIKSAQVVCRVESNNEIIKLSSECIFYKDAVLKNGDIVEVVSNKEGNLIANFMNGERNVVLKDSIDSISFQAGFEFADKIVEKVYKDLTQETSEETSEEETSEEIDEEETSDEIDEEETSEEEKEEIVLSEPEYSDSSFFMSEEIKNKTFVEEIITKGNMEHLELDIYKISDQYDSIINKLQSNIQVDYQIKGSIFDKKAILACIVAYNMEYVDFKEYCKTLFENGYFYKNKQDLSINIFVKNIFACKTSISEIKSLFKKNAFESVFKFLECYDSLIKSISSYEMKVKPKVESEIIPIIRKKEKNTPVLLFKDLLTSNISDDKTKIDWNNYRNELNKFKMELAKKKETDTINKDTYIFIEENLERAPFVLRELRKYLTAEFERLYSKKIENDEEFRFLLDRTIVEKTNLLDNVKKYLELHRVFYKLVNYINTYNYQPRLEKKRRAIETNKMRLSDISSKRNKSVSELSVDMESLKL